MLPGRSKRALKHEVGNLGIKRLERRKWSENELLVLRNNPQMSAKELSIKLGRSKYQVAHKLRIVRGTANKRFKKGWNSPSKDLAYFLGAIASDVGVYKYTVEIVQKLTNIELCEDIKRIISEIFGMSATTSVLEANGVEYRRLWVSSTEFLKELGTEEGIECGNIRGKDGEWIRFIDEKFSWVFEDDGYFWEFVGGWFDGDGCLVKRANGYRLVKIGVQPEESRNRMIAEFKKKGFEFSEESCRGKVSQICLLGGSYEVKRFVSLLKAKIKRKKNL